MIAQEICLLEWLGKKNKKTGLGGPWDKAVIRVKKKKISR